MDVSASNMSKDVILQKLQSGEKKDTKMQQGKDFNVKIQHLQQLQ